MLDFNSFTDEQRYDYGSGLIATTINSIFDNANRNDFCSLGVFVIGEDHNNARNLMSVNDSASGAVFYLRHNGVNDRDILCLMGITNGVSSTFPVVTLSINTANPNTFGAGIGHKLWIGNTFATEGTDRFLGFLAWEQNDGTYFYATGINTAGLFSGYRFRGANHMCLAANTISSAAQYRYGHRHQLAYMGFRNHIMDFDEFQYIVEKNDPSLFGILNSGNFNGLTGHILSLPYIVPGSDPFTVGVASGENVNTNSLVYTAYGSAGTMVRPTGTSGKGQYLFRDAEPKWKPALDTFDPLNYFNYYSPTGSHRSRQFSDLYRLVTDNPDRRIKIGLFANSRDVRVEADYSSTGVLLNGNYTAISTDYLTNHMALDGTYGNGVFSQRVGNTVGATVPLYKGGRLSSGNGRRSFIVMDSTNKTGGFYTSGVHIFNNASTSHLLLDQNARRLGWHGENSSRPGPGDVISISPGGRADVWVHNVGKITDDSKLTFRCIFAGLPGRFGSDVLMTTIAATGVPGNTVGGVVSLANVASGTVNTRLPVICSGTIMQGVLGQNVGSNTTFSYTASKLNSAWTSGQMIASWSGSSPAVAFSIINSGVYTGLSGQNIRIESPFNQAGSSAFVPSNRGALTCDFEYVVGEVTWDPAIQGSGYPYRGVRIRHKGGSSNAYLINVEVYNPDEPGWHWNPNGHGGVGVVEQMADVFETRGSRNLSPFGKYLEVLDNDIWFIAGAQQNSSPSNTVTLIDRIKEATPDAEIVLSYETSHPQNLNHSTDASNWASYFIENAEGLDCIGISAYDYLGIGLQQFYYGFRTDASHYTSLGSVNIGKRWLEILSTIILGSTGGMSAFTMLRAQTFFKTAHRRRGN